MSFDEIKKINESIDLLREADRLNDKIKMNLLKNDNKSKNINKC